jgi:transcriptional regulator of arginine metabolism
MKHRRHAKILELINAQEIYTQEELAEKLNSIGFDITQATISRDIKELKLLKIPSKDKDGQYKYAHTNTSDDKVSAKFYNILKETVIDIKPAKNLLVVKTYSGMAQAAGAAIDAIDFPEALGTIAGDDTMLLIFAEDATAELMARKLEKITENE